MLQFLSDIFGVMNRVLHVFIFYSLMDNGTCEMCTLMTSTAKLRLPHRHCCYKWALYARARAPKRAAAAVDTTRRLTASGTFESTYSTSKKSSLLLVSSVCSVSSFNFACLVASKQKKVSSSLTSRRRPTPPITIIIARVRFAHSLSALIKHSRSGRHHKLAVCCRHKPLARRRLLGATCDGAPPIAAAATSRSTSDDDTPLPAFHSCALICARINSSSLK